MKKQYKLKDKRQFNEVIKTGKKLKNINYVVYFLPYFEVKIGITISKKTCNAPKRNYHKRVIRSICQQNILKIPNAKIVIIGRDNLKNISYDQKSKSLLELLERIKIE